MGAARSFLGALVVALSLTGCAHVAVPKAPEQPAPMAFAEPC